jgi:hypothetical protein
MSDNFVFDSVLETGLGLKFYKTREVDDNNKTTYRVIEVEGNNVNINHPFIKELFKQYETSILKHSQSFNEFTTSLQLNDFRVTLIPDLKGDKFFDDRWNRVVRFVEKHSKV